MESNQLLDLLAGGLALLIVGGGLFMLIAGVLEFNKQNK